MEVWAREAACETLRFHNLTFVTEMGALEDIANAAG